MGVQQKVVETLQSFEVFGSMVDEGAATTADDALAKVQAAQEAGVKALRFQSMVECAYLIASADGNTSAEELSHIKDNMSAISGGSITPEAVGAYIDHSAKMVGERGRDASISGLAERLSGDEREAAFIAGANAAWTGGGVGAKEGLCMQAIARAFGWEISHMHKLLGKARG